jgi:hypothetical protein
MVVTLSSGDQSIRHNVKQSPRRAVANTYTGTKPQASPLTRNPLLHQVSTLIVALAANTDCARVWSRKCAYECAEPNESH